MALRFFSSLPSTLPPLSPASGVPGIVYGVCGPPRIPSGSTICVTILWQDSAPSTRCPSVHACSLCTENSLRSLTPVPDDFISVACLTRPTLLPAVAFRDPGARFCLPATQICIPATRERFWGCPFEVCVWNGRASSSRKPAAGRGFRGGPFVGGVDRSS